MWTTGAERWPPGAGRAFLLHSYAWLSAGLGFAVSWYWASPRLVYTLSGLIRWGSLAAAIGAGTLQRNAGRRVTPESFTDGTSEQRQEWFIAGYRSGDVNACDTFSSRAL